MNSTIKKTIICRHVNQFNISAELATKYIPKTGDVAVFEILSLGKHKSLQGENGKNIYIFEGDYIMAAFGNRYATNQFEGYVPKKVLKEYDILGMGGAVGEMTSMHSKMDNIGTTKLRLVGYCIEATGKVINTQYLHIDPIRFQPKKIRNYKVVLSVGASMDSGKTTSAAYLCRGLRAAGKKVAFVKLTGTVFSKDKHFVRDCGAEMVVDFSNLGFPSTYMYSLNQLMDIYEGLLTKVERIDPEYVVVEIADGLFQRETNMLLNHAPFMATVSKIILSCADSLSVLSGLRYLENINFAPFAISGLINTSPLLVREVKEQTTIPVLGLGDLSSENIVNQLNRLGERSLIA